MFAFKAILFKNSVIEPGVKMHKAACDRGGRYSKRCRSCAGAREVRIGDGAGVEEKK
jgi:hypothetical protein